MFRDLPSNNAMTSYNSQVRKKYFLNVTFFVLFIETMEDWDEDKLEEVVNKKHGESDKAKPKTSIVSSSQNATSLKQRPLERQKGAVVER